MLQGQVFLKGRDDIFPISFFQRLSFLNFAKFCYGFEEKLFFSTTIILGKKVILICPKMNLKIN